MRVFISSTIFSEKNPHSRKNSARYDQKYILVIGLRVKYPLFLSDFIKTKFFDRFSKNAQNTNFMKIRPLRFDLFHADGRTDGQTGTLT